MKDTATLEAGEHAQDAAVRWLKHHVATLSPRQGIFLTEAEVCKATGMSRTPVREALLRLEAEGMLQIVPKKGAFVPPITDEDVTAVMQARQLIEDWCIRRASAYGPALADELLRLVDEQENLKHSPVEFIERDREFHRLIVGAGGNLVLASFYETLRDRQMRMGLQAIGAFEQRADTVLAEHRRIVGSLRSGDAEAASTAMADHLEQTLAALKVPVPPVWMQRTV